MDCECAPKCIFFNDRMFNMPSTAEIFKQKYCRGEFASCGRFMVYEVFGPDKVPADLFPNQQERARALLAGR